MATTDASTSATVAVGIVTLLPLLFLIGLRLVLLALGWSLYSKGHERRNALYVKYKKDAKASEQELEVENGWEKVDASTLNDSQDEWSGIIGFFHPFCNAGGGGERVLWAAIEATQHRYPKALCAVYTGDHDIDRDTVVAAVKKRFDISLRSPTLHFIYLSKRHLVLPHTYPYFTLLGQSLGSVILAYEAFSLLVPDIFIDTMGYAFAVALCKYLFMGVPTAAYVHYPTISTDMLESLDDTTGGKGIHSGAGTGWKGRAKKIYWHAFAWLYGWVGRQIDVVMCNSSWTSGHISQLWKPSHASVVYPPCPVREIESKIDISLASEKKRENVILYVAQFRPEKNHSLVLQAFAKFYHSSQAKTKPRLALIGSVRSNTPDEKHIYSLRLLARELKIDAPITSFMCDAPFSTILSMLQVSNIGVNGMYAEHFGIGNVEGVAAGCIPVVNDSGGPKLDIVVPYQGKPIGYHARTDEEYAEAFRKVEAMTDKERYEMRVRGRQSAQRFTGEVFEKKWVENLEVLVKMQTKGKK